MDGRKKIKTVYPSARQKKRLLEFITEHPELITCRVSQDFNYNVSQNLWNTIAAECNSIPGAKKTWRQWRKTWQDLRSKTKKRLKYNGDLPRSLELLTPAEQEALGVNPLTNKLSKEEYSGMSEFIPVEEDYTNDDLQSEMEESAPESPPEPKVFTRSQNKPKVNTVKNSKHECVFNCDLLALQEQRKIDVKEDYLKFKMEYLKQKLKCMQEQTDALKAIAKELSK